MLVSVPVSPFQTDTHPQIQGQAVGDTPIVLEVGFENFVAVIEFQLIAALA